MRKSLTIGGALFALAAFASTADARMMGGGGGMNMSPSMSHGGPISSSMSSSSVSSSTASPRGFSPDGRTFSPDGFQTRVKGSNWKHPIDSDGGGPSDPPNKPPKGSTQGNGGDTSKDRPGYYGYGNHDKGWYDQYGHHHGPWPSGHGSSAGNSEPAPASRTPR